VIEPVVQLIWAPRSGMGRLAEDSTLVEFDEGNLFALNRYPGSDAVETGPRANIGIGWTRFAPGGWSMGVTVGRVLRDAPSSVFSVASGLAAQNSDWLAAGQITLANGSRLTTRAVFDDGLSLTKGEMRLDLSTARLDVAAGYVWTLADPVIENRPDPTREVTLDAGYRLSPNWTGKASGRYDFALQTGTVAGLGMEFRNECMRVDLSLSRRFTSSTTVRPTTDFGLSVDLVGFGSGAAAGPARTCRR
jgi:LPS-assembly protein